MQICTCIKGKMTEYLIQNVNLKEKSFLVEILSRVKVLTKQEAHGPHRSPEKTVQINKHI